MQERPVMNITDLSALPMLATLDARIPKWKIESLYVRSCPICRRPDPPVFRRPDGVPVSYCADCMLWYVCGIPSEAEIYAVYQGYWFDYRPRQLNARGARAVLEGARKVALVDLRIQRLRALLGTLKDKLVLEVGAGRGEFLSAVRCAGAHVIGNDISAESCDFLERALDIPVVRGDLAAQRWRFGAPDVIVMNDLIEHPIEPLPLLSQAVGLLKQGGRLLIWTPNGGGAGKDPATAESWVGFRVDLEHLQYFSPGTIQVLAATLGLHIDHLETTGYPALGEVGRLPAKNTAGSFSSLVTMGKAVAGRIAPWITQARQIAREMRLPRVCGSYHLFAILRKP